MDLTFERGLLAGHLRGLRPSDGIYEKDNGEVIAQGELGPIFVGVMQFTTRAVIERGATSPATSSSSTTPAAARWT